MLSLLLLRGDGVIVVEGLSPTPSARSSFRRACNPYVKSKIQSVYFRGGFARKSQRNGDIDSQLFAYTIGPIGALLHTNFYAKFYCGEAVKQAREANK